MQCTCGRRRFRSRGISVIAVVLVVLAATACESFRRLPPTDAAAIKEQVPGRTVRFTTASGAVVLKVREVDFPYVSGVPDAGNGLVEFDVRTAKRADLVVNSTAWKAIPTTEEGFTLEAVSGLPVRFTTDRGFVTLVVDQVQFPYIVGRPRQSQGIVRLDLRQVGSLEIRETDFAKIIALTTVVVGGSLLIISTMVDDALFKSSSSSGSCGCPSVFLNRGQGSEFVGKAYTGAAFRALQRDDLLPLPALTSGRVQVRLANEASETQHTDHAQIVLVDHAPNVRALSTFDGHPTLVGVPTAPSSARDVQGHDVLALVSARDERTWETDLLSAAAAEGEPLPDQMELTFPSPTAGDPVLEFGGANTSWLDYVAGRAVATAGNALDQYMPVLNSPMAGPAIKAWLDSEGVNLTVEVFDNGAWRRAATLPPVDAAALREIAVPLTLSSPRDPSGVKIRLRGGLGFWKIDRVALSSRVEAPMDLHRVRPTNARVRGGRVELPSIAAADGRYQILAGADDTLDLTFDLPPLGSGRVRSSFLLTKGYYEMTRPAAGPSSRDTAATLDKPGALSWLSRDLAREILHITRPSRESNESRHKD